MQTSTLMIQKTTLILQKIILEAEAHGFRCKLSSNEFENIKIIKKYSTNCKISNKK